MANEYINRNNAIERLRDYKDNHGTIYEEGFNDAIDVAIAELSVMPADVIPVKWILKQDGGDELVNRWNEYKEE